ncbi:MAG: pyridoxamine 5'-phosphate oxidase family protein [Yoonia sp.]|nr:pyridoxamine 5'-phosphate oxidase family protein [Yoonia sp.]
MNDWFCDLDGLWSFAWDQIGARDGARLWALSTTGRDGWPDARTVVLRGSDADQKTLQFHTDLYSEKVKDLQLTPSASLLCWLPTPMLQIRLRVNVRVQSGAAVSGIWENVPDPARQSYGTTPAPATPITSALDYTKPADPAAFAVLECAVDQIDLMHLGADHRRAIYSRGGDWAGQWVAP